MTPILPYLLTAGERESERERESEGIQTSRADTTPQPPLEL
jgi:hypothetical protein